MPPELRQALIEAYHRLGAGAPVAVRSSATGEDTAGTSFAGMNETFTNVIGDDGAARARCVRCWMSLFGRAGARLPRVAADRRRAGDRRRGAAHGRLRALRRDVHRRSGDRRSRSHRRSRPRSGSARSSSAARSSPTPTCSPSAGRRLLEVRIGHKTHKIVRGAERRRPARRALARRGAAARAHRRRAASRSRELGLAHRAPLRRAAGRRVGRSRAATIYLVQSRPITTLGAERAAGARATVLVSGLGASPGLASGPVRVLRSPPTAPTLQAGEVLVAPMTTPDWVPTLRRAAALVTDERRHDLPRRDRQPRAAASRASSAPATRPRVLRDGERGHRRRQPRAQCSTAGRRADRRAPVAGARGRRRRRAGRAARHAALRQPRDRRAGRGGRRAAGRRRRACCAPSS